MIVFLGIPYSLEKGKNLCSLFLRTNYSHVKNIYFVRCKKNRKENKASTKMQL